MSAAPPHRAQAAQGLRAWVKRLAPLILLLAAAALIIAMGWHRYLTLEELAGRRESLRAYITDAPLLSLAVYGATYAAVVALSLPGGAVLTLAGGLLFGWVVGGIAAVVAATIGASVIFLVARSIFAEPLAARAGPRLERLRRGFQEDAFNYLLFLRLVPIFPFWLINLAPGLLGVGFGTYLLATFLGIIPGTFAFAIAGNGLDSVIEAQQALHQSCLAKMGAEAQKFCPFTLDPTALLTPELIAGLVALGLVALVPIVVKKLKRAA